MFYSGGVGVGTGGAFSGDLVGTGEGTPCGTLRVGSGNAGTFRFAFAFVLVLLFSLAFVFTLAAGLTSTTGSGELSAFAFVFVFTVAGTVTAPPAGIACSALPVGEAPGCTGWLFGSAASVCCGWFVF